MAGTTLKNTLRPEVIMDLVKATMDIPGGVLPAAFSAAAVMSKANKNEGSYLRVDGTRHVARIVAYGSPAAARGMRGVTKVPVTLAHTYESQDQPGTMLLDLEGENGVALQGIAKEEVWGQVTHFAGGFKNLRTVAMAAALAHGAVYFDGDGNILPDSTGAVISVDFGIPAGNKDQLDVFGDGDLLSTDWTAAATDIITQIRDVKEASRKKTGYPLVYAFYGANIPGYLSANTSVRAFLTANPQLASQVLVGDNLPDICGLKWLPLECFWNDQDGTTQSVMDADRVVFCPAPSKDWWGLIEGSYAIPTNHNVTANANTARSSLKTVFGPFSYATVSDNPPGLTQYGGDTFLPVIKVPGAVFIGDVPTS